MAKLEEIEGIGEKYAEKLHNAGIRGTGQFIKKAATPEGRKAIEKASGISGKLILEWANHIDLFRIKGVGPEYADLLEEAGVDTVPELATRNAENLVEAMNKVNQKKKLVRVAPGRAKVEDWIKQAKKLPRVLEY